MPSRDDVAGGAPATDDGSSKVDAALRALGERLLDDGELELTLREVAVLAHEAVPGCNAVDVTLLLDDLPADRGTSNELARVLGRAQYASATGPGLDASRSGRPVRVGSISAEPRWPSFCGTAVDAGISSVMAIPLLVRGHLIGVISLYSFAEQAWARPDEEAARQFADRAAVVIENARTHAHALRVARQLAAALESRGTIEQAKGILMGIHRCSADAAFELLVARSQGENRKLRAVAASVIDEMTAGRALTPSDHQRES